MLCMVSYCDGKVKYICLFLLCVNIVGLLRCVGAVIVMVYWNMFIYLCV